MGFRLLPKGVEEGAFKPVPDGWLFKTAHPPYLRPRRTYFVTDAQKPAVAARVRRSRYANMLMVAIEVPLIMAACAKYPWLLSLSPKAFIAWGAVIAFISAAAVAIDRLIMRPVIRDLPRTTQTISMVDSWRSESRSMSPVALAVFTAFSALCAAINLHTALTDGKMFAWLGAAFMACLGLYFGAMLVAKLRAKSRVGHR